MMRDRFSDLEDEISLRELALVPWKRKAVVAGCASFCTLAAILVSFAMTPRYKATSTIEINEDKQSGSSVLSSLASAASGGADDLKVKMETQIAVRRGLKSVRKLCPRVDGKH
jgi:uncharacterized protein involved in exopolysaccharide biosynthesis